MAVSIFNRWRTTLVAALAAVALPFTVGACTGDEGDEEGPTIIEEENEQEGQDGEEGENGEEGRNGEGGENGNSGQSG